MNPAVFFLALIALFVGKTQQYNIYSYEKRNKITFIPTNNAKIELVKEYEKDDLSKFNTVEE